MSGMRREISCCTSGIHRRLRIRRDASKNELLEFLFTCCPQEPDARRESYAIFERRRPSAGLAFSTKFGVSGKLAWVSASFQLIEDHTH